MSPEPGGRRKRLGFTRNSSAAPYSQCKEALPSQTALSCLPRHKRILPIIFRQKALERSQCGCRDPGSIYFTGLRVHLRPKMLRVAQYTNRHFTQLGMFFPENEGATSFSKPFFISS